MKLVLVLVATLALTLPFTGTATTPAKAAGCAEPTGCTCVARGIVVSFPPSYPAHTDQVAANTYCAMLNHPTR